MQFLTQLAAVCLLAGCVNAIVMPPDKDGTLAYVLYSVALAVATVSHCVFTCRFV